jgi:threonine/homoserine/homoserine lactone efflux protein
MDCEPVGISGTGEGRKGSDTMLGIHDLPTFMLASLVLNAIPGPDTLYIVSRSVSQGRRAGLVSALGISTGCLVHTGLAAFGLSTILAASATAFESVKIAGAFYLIYLGLRALRKRPGATGNTPPPPRPAVALYRQGVMTNVLNPKVALFFLAFLPQFIVPDAGLGPVPFLALGSLFVAQGTLWCVLVVLFASRATEAIRTNGRAAGMLERLTGVVFIALGLNLLRARAHPG